MNHIKPIRRALSIIVVLAGLLSGFAPGFACAAIPIGALWDLSGPDAGQGKAALRAAREAVKDINSQAGPLNPHIEIIVADTQGKKEQVLLQASKMIKEEGVIALIGTTEPGLSVILRRIAESYQVPLVLTSGQSPLLPARGGIPMRWTFSSNPRMDVWIKALLKRLRKSGIRTIGPLIQDNRMGHEIGLWLRAYAQEMRIRVLPAQSFNVKDADVIAQLNWFRDQGAQIAVVWGPPDWSPTLMASSLESGMPVAVPPCMLTTFITSALASKIGIISVVPPVVMGQNLSSSHPCALSVLKFLNAMEGRLPTGAIQEQMSAGAAWDAIYLISRALKKAETPTRKALRDAMEEAEEPYYGVMGVFKPDKRDHCGLIPDSLLLFEKEKTEGMNQSGPGNGQHAYF